MILRLMLVTGLLLVPGGTQAQQPAPLPYCPQNILKGGSFPAAPTDAEAKALLGRAKKKFGENFQPREGAELEAWVRTKPPAVAGTLGALLAPVGFRDAGPYLVVLGVQKLPRDEQGWNNLGALLYRAGERQDAVLALQYAYALAPKKVGPLANLGKAAFDMGQLELAEEVYGRAVKQEPQFDEAWVGLAAVARCQGDVPRSDGYLAKVRNKRLFQVMRPTLQGAKPKPKPQPPQVQPGAPATEAQTQQAEAAYYAQKGLPHPDEDLGHGLSPDHPNIPSSGDAPQMLRLLPNLMSFVRYAQEHRTAAYEESKNFQVDLATPVVVSNWATRRIAAMHRHDAKLFTDLAGVKNNTPLQGGPVPPDNEAFEERHRRCGQLPSPNATQACESKVRREQCARQRSYQLEKWQFEHGRWAGETNRKVVILNDWYRRYTDAAHHALNRDFYRRAMLHAEQRLWTFYFEAAHELLAMAEHIDARLADDQAEWCYENQPPTVEMGSLNVPRLKRPTHWCPESLQGSVNVPGVCKLTAGCKEVGFEIQDGPLKAKAHYNFSRGELTAYAGAGGEVGHFGAEAGVYITCTKNGIQDVGVSAEASATDANKVELKFSAAAQTVHAQVTLVNQVTERTVDVSAPEARQEPQQEMSPVTPLPTGKP